MGWGGEGGIVYSREAKESHQLQQARVSRQEGLNRGTYFVLVLIWSFLCSHSMIFFFHCHACTFFSVYVCVCVRQIWSVSELVRF